MIIPILLEAKRDELAYGWLLRLAYANGYDSVYRFFCRYFSAVPHYGNRASIPLRMDYIPNWELVQDRFSEMKLFPDTISMLRYMTPYFTTLPFYRYGYQAIRLLSMLRPESVRMYSPVTVWEVKELRYCPKCMKEEPYFKTWHQLAGVRACAKHGCTLCTVERPGNTDLFETIQTEALDVSEAGKAEFSVSRFMKAMYDRPIFMDSTVLQEEMRIRMEEIGYSTEQPYGSLSEDMRRTGYADLLMDPNEPVKRIRSLTKKNFSGNDMAVFLIFLFGNYDVFYKRVSRWEQETAPLFEEVTFGRFELLSEYGPIVQLRCLRCGYEFYTHPYDLVLGGSCLRCGTATVEEEVNRRLETVGDGEYVLEGFPGGEGKGKTRIRHRTCGKSRAMSLRDAVWGEQECKCRYRADLDKIRKQVRDAAPGFFMVAYHGKHYKGGTGRSVTICHENCGRTFTVILESFLRSPFCRLCNPTRHSREVFQKMMQEVAGNEYELVSEYKSLRDKVVVRHMECGTLMELSGDAFLAGQRCRLCTPRIEVEEAERMLAECTGRSYRIVGKGKNRGEVVVEAPDGKQENMDIQMLIQELVRPSEPRFVKIRYSKPKLPEKTLKKVYDHVREACENSETGTWIYHGVFGGIRQQNIWSCLRKLVKYGYLERLGVREFKLDSKRLVWEEEKEVADTSLHETV